MGGIKSSSVVYTGCDVVEKSGQPAVLFCEDDPQFDCHLEVYPRPATPADPKADKNTQPAAAAGMDAQVYLCGLGGSPELGDTELREGGV